MTHTITVSDDGRAITLGYDGLLAYHGGGAVAGAATGFRVMQAAAEAITGSGQPLERQQLHVVSGHPGPGYRDAFEYVTRCVTRRRFELKTDLPGGRHGPYQNYAYQFIVTDTAAGQQITVTLRREIIPRRFFEVLRNLRDSGPDLRLTEELESLKTDLAGRVLALPLDELFQVTIRETTPSPDNGPGDPASCMG